MLNERKEDMKKLKLYIDKSDYELLNIVSCVTYDMSLHKTLYKNKFQKGNIFILVNKNTAEETKVIIEEIEFLDGTYWLKVIK